MSGARGGCMALNRVGPKGVLFRGVPQNTIQIACLEPTGISTWRIENPRVILAPSDFPWSYDGREMVGVEDPTYMDRQISPFVGSGMFYTGTARKPGSNDLNAFLMYAYLDSLGDVEHVRTVFTPEQAMKMGLAD